MDNLYRIADLVYEILLTDEHARNSDDYLYYQVCQKVCPMALSDKFGDVLKSFDDYNLPAYESVGRCRRKIQADFPELAGNKVVRKWRADRIEEYKKYARREVL